MAVRQLSDANADGTCLGQSATDLIGFYGATPVARPAGAGQAAVTDSSGGTAATALATITGTFNQSIIANNFATLARQTNALCAALISLGLVKGSA